LAKAGSPAPWNTRPAKRTCLFSIIVSHGSSAHSPSRAATGATPNCCAPLRFGSGSPGGKRNDPRRRFVLVLSSHTCATVSAVSLFDL
jgi:hypothetical protein